MGRRYDPHGPDAFQLAAEGIATGQLRDSEVRQGLGDKATNRSHAPIAHGDRGETDEVTAARALAGHCNLLRDCLREYRPRPTPPRTAESALLIRGRTSGVPALGSPLPPDAVARRRRRTGDAFRGHDYSGKRWREHDMPLLGWRYREPYATKSTFITLVIEDGAKPDVIRDRVTHTKAARDAFSGYDRGPHWIETCGEVSKLQLTRRLATSFATAGQLLELSDERSGGGGSRTRVRR